MDALLSRKNTRRSSKLLFGTSKGNPDYHLWDKLKAIAKRANLDPTTVWLHKWRATAATNWLRSKELGGKGWDVGFVRQQLGHEDMKSIEHYIALIRSEELALREYAALPGQGSNKDEVVWLPIDAKFPLEDSQRLIEAQERTDADALEAAGKQLENRIKSCAKDISEKYLNQPNTTDFGILFLPIEGLFAEAIRRTGLIETIQRDYRVVVAGPTTLWSILSSLQMGFRTLAIQKRSSEVWNLLAGVKTEWTKYGEVLDAVQKKLHQASDTIERAQVRSRAIGRKLKDVQELPVDEATVLLPDTLLGDEAEPAEVGTSEDVEETEEESVAAAASQGQ